MRRPLSRLLSLAVSPALALAPLAAASPSLDAQPAVALRPGMVITRSVRIRPGTYRFSAPASLDSALVTVRGNGITVDMRGVRLVGLPEAADPDRAAGVALRIEGGSDVRITGATIRGYRFGILARRTRRLVLVGNDLSYGWKPRLFSLVQHESLVDWLSFHKNEHDEWLRFGAGIYLDGVRGGELRSNRAEQGMNALLMTRTDSLLVVENDFSFNSGLGIGMYRSSGNRILHNRANFDVRGYSHGFFRRGQDSAALLMFEQCTGNVVAYNSMTHGGDGLFLWAGQQTMDTGAGGSNDNLFWGNDFSFAPTNGMEATFSRNDFIANRVEGNDHGLWGGYSYDSRVIGNRFARNRIAIAVEHGQANTVAHNTFDGDSTALRLWANPIEPSDWGYPKHRDTRSRDWTVMDNRFARHRVAVRASGTTGLAVTGNTLARVDSVAVLADSAGLAWSRNDVDADAASGSALPPLPDSIARLAPAREAGAFMPDDSPRARRDRSAIVVDEWGPFDWRSPKLWPADSGRGPVVRLRVLGPPGEWRVVSSRGLARGLSSRGRVGDTLVVEPAPAARGDWAVTLEYRGAATISPRGERRAAGVPVRFAYERWEPAVAWHARWFAWGDRDPRTDSAAMRAILATTPLLEQHLPRLDAFGFGAPARGLPREKVAMDATARIALPAGRYTLRAISDDAVRVWVDGRLVIDAWTPHESRVDYAAIPGGALELRVQYLQVGGWTELRLEVLRGAVAAAAGSPGPH